MKAYCYRTKLNILLIVASILSIHFNNSNRIIAQSAPPEDIIIDSAGICPEYPGGLAVPPPSTEESIEEAQSLGGDVIKGMYPENIKQIYGLYVYGVDTGVPLTVNYNVTYVGDFIENPENGLPTRYFAFLDEQFIPLGDGNELHRDVILPWKKNLTIPIQLPALESGLYDLVVIGIAEPDKAPLERPGLPSPPTGNEGHIETLSFRITIIAGNPSEIPLDDERTYTSLSEGLPNLEPPSDSAYPTLQFAIGERFAFWTFPEYTPTLKLSPNSEFTYYLHLAYSSYAVDYNFYDGGFLSANPDATRFALILLDGVQPVPINSNDLIFYGEVPNDIYFGRLETTTKTPTTGIKNLTAVRIDFPGQSLCEYIPAAGFGISAMMVSIEADAGE